MSVSKKFLDAIINIYGREENQKQRQYVRYQNLIDKHRRLFPADDLHLFSTPGRTEIGGNHTDHNHGRVLAASIDLDTIAVVTKNKSDNVILYSEGYNQAFKVDLSDLKIRAQEKGTTAALIRGIAAQLKSLGCEIGGFNAHVTSDVLPGSGLSSSAAIEVLIATIFNALFNKSTVPADLIAKIGQFAENVYFGKPCGLMDQMACAIGGIIAIDFKNPEMPVIKKVKFDLDKYDFCLLVVDTGGSHADLTDDYAAVPAEMGAVAQALGATVCRDISYADILSNMGKLRTDPGDRAVLRALHFLQENERVVQQVDALENGDFARFLQLVRDSGNSSFKYLQNIYTPTNVREQGIALALNLTEHDLAALSSGACRVHGGGFAGAILVFMPNQEAAEYLRMMESVYGKGCVRKLSIRSSGTLYLNEMAS